MRQSNEQPAVMELMEPRLLMAAVAANVNLSRMVGNQSETAVAIDPTDARNLFVASNIDSGLGLFTARSHDGGQTWAKRTLANGHGALGAACCDPSVAYDGFGNLYVAFLDDRIDAARLLISSDAGDSFALLKTFNGSVDQPTVAAGQSSVWVTFEQGDKVRVAGARVLGKGSVATLRGARAVAGSDGGNFGDIAVGPDGQVMVAWQAPVDADLPGALFVSLDPDGVGPEPFGAAVRAARTNVGGFYPIDATYNNSIDAEVGLAFDTSDGPGRGTAYMVYTDVVRSRASDTNVFVKVSIDNGASWGRAVRVNDDSGTASQLLPKLAVDPASGDLAVAWYDGRNDKGVRGNGSTNRISNDDAQVYAAVGRLSAGALTFGANVRISEGTSNASRADNDIDFGDYIGLAFFDGVFVPAWADNSNSTRDNPAGSLKSFDIYAARVDASAL